MKTIALFSQKGGSGKSTLAIHLAVAASDEMPVLLVDCDPQGTALAWATARRARTPPVVRGDAGSIRAPLAQAQASGTQLVILDCPPHAAAATASLLQLADHVIIPAQPTMPDLAATQRSMALARACARPFTFVVNRAPARAPEVPQTIAALAAAGTVAPTVIGDRRAFARALSDGYAVTQAPYASSQAAQEILALWNWLRTRIEIDLEEHAWQQAA